VRFLDLLRVRKWPLKAQKRLGVCRAQALDPAFEAVRALADKPLCVYRELEGAPDVTWFRVAAASPLYPSLIPLRDEIESWAATYHLDAEPLKQIALETLELWSGYDPAMTEKSALRRREWAFWVAHMEGGPQRLVRKTQTPDPYVWAVLSQVRGWRYERIAKWHNGRHRPPEHEREKRTMTTDGVKKQVLRTLDLIGLPPRVHVSGRSNRARDAPTFNVHFLSLVSAECIIAAFLKRIQSASEATSL